MNRCCTAAVAIAIAAAAALAGCGGDTILASGDGTADRPADGADADVADEATDGGTEGDGSSADWSWPDVVTGFAVLHGIGWGDARMNLAYLTAVD